MKNKIILYVEKKLINKKLPVLRSGYLVNIKSWVIDMRKKRFQNFKGIIISIRNNYLNTSLILRKMSYGVCIEKSFKLYSPTVYKIDVIKKNNVRKSKLYYLRYNNKNRLI